MERERIFEFLEEHNIEFDQVRIQLLGKEFMPSLNQVLSDKGKRRKKNYDA